MLEIFIIDYFGLYLCYLDGFSGNYIHSHFSFSFCITCPALCLTYFHNLNQLCQLTFFSKFPSRHFLQYIGNCAIYFLSLPFCEIFLAYSKQFRCRRSGKCQAWTIFSFFFIVFLQMKKRSKWRNGLRSTVCEIRHDIITWKLNGALKFVFHFRYCGMVFFASIAAFPNLQFFFFILLLVRQGYICRWKGKILFYFVFLLSLKLVCCVSGIFH